MKCYYHKEEEAVGQCQGCGKFLCKECFDKNGGFCDDCKSAQKENVKSQLNAVRGNSIKGLVIQIILAVVFGGVCTYIFRNIDTNLVLVFYFGAGIPFGWDTINWILGKLNLGNWYFSGIVLLIMLFIKLWFAVIIGVIWPIYLIMNIYTINKMNKAKKEADKA